MREVFSDILTSESILDSAQDKQHYGRDWIKDFQPSPALILLPKDSQQVQAIVRRCNQLQIPLVPSGGRTGLSGGATAANGEVILSLERLNKILEVNPIDRTLVCQAGVITQRVQDEATKHQLYFPVDFSSKGSSQVGGNAATNAGGIRVIKYGNFRESVLGLKVVTGGGDLLELNGALFKNQTGYDLKSLIIGSEGTLGIITELTLRLTEPPGEIIRILCGLDQRESVLPLLQKTRSNISNVSAFEFFSRPALEKVMLRHKLPDPLESNHPYYVLIEIERVNNQSREQSELFFADLMESRVIADAVISQSSAQADQLMAYRERISESLSSMYTLHKNDISVPVPQIPNFLDRLDQLLKQEYPNFEVIVFGHIGDGNLHLNVLCPSAMAAVDFFQFCKSADHQVFGLVQELGGSISAEHGVGMLKKAFLKYSRSPEEIALMRAIKSAFDPKGILNPGKIFD